MGALSGLRVLEFGQYVPGPLLGMLLADQGAEVIKIERPSGDPARGHPAFATWNRGKRSVVLDLKSPHGREAAHALAHQADVLIENFRPSVAERLGIGYQDLAAANPRLIYCSLPGFGPDSPYRHRQGWEPLVGAATGLYQKIEGASEEPVFLPLPLASTYGAIVGAMAITMALNARHRSGRGQRIEASLYNAMFAAMGTRMVRLLDLEPIDRSHFTRLVMARHYRCADGRWIYHHGTFKSFVEPSLKAMGYPERVQAALEQFDRPVPPEAAREWLDLFESTFRQRTAFEWEEAVNRAGGACGACRTIDEWLENKHALAAGMVVTVHDPNLGPMKQPGVQVRLRGSPGAVQGPAPLLGQHTQEVLARLRQPDSPPSATPASQPNLAAALQGVRVLDLSIILAGPTCGRTLAEFGAEVIKIDDPRRHYEAVWNIDVNRAKRSILLDLKREEGRQVFWRLVEKADVVLQNYRRGSLARIGLGYEDVRKRRPDIIYASVSCYGYGGPWEQRPGWEQLAQAVSGIQVRRGGRDGKPALLPYPMNDYGTGILAAYAVALALYHRQRTGQGQEVDTGLALTAGLLQSAVFMDYHGFQRRELEGPALRGFSALSRLYRAADGWLFLHSPREQDWPALTALPEFQHLTKDPRFASPASRTSHDGDLAQALGAVIALHSVSHWDQRLSDARVNVMPAVLTPSVLQADPAVRRAGLVVSRQRTGWGRIEHLGLVPSLSATPPHLGRPAPVLGAETEEILQETGYTADEIAHLEGAGVVEQANADTPFRFCHSGLRRP